MVEGFRSCHLLTRWMRRGFVRDEHPGGHQALPRMSLEELASCHERARCPQESSSRTQSRRGRSLRADIAHQLCHASAPAMSTLGKRRRTKPAVPSLKRLTMTSTDIRQCCSDRRRLESGESDECHELAVPLRWPWSRSAWIEPATAVALVTGRIRVWRELCGGCATFILDDAQEETSTIPGHPT